MELLVEVVHGAGRSTDVVLEVEPGATFGDVADALAFLDAPDGGTLPIARTGQTPRRDDRVADVDVRSGDRLTLVDSVNAAFSVTPEAFGATLVVTVADRRRDRVPAALRRQPPRSRLRQRRRHQGPAGVPPPRPHHRHRRRHDRRPRLEERRRHRRHGDHHADGAAARADGRDRRPDAVDPRPRPRRRGAGVAATASSSTARRGSTRPYGGVEVELPAPPERPRRQRLPMISAVLPVAPRHRHVLPDRPDRRDLHAAVAGPADRQRDRGQAHRAVRVQGGARRARQRRRRAGRSTSSSSGSRRSAAASARLPGAGELGGIVRSLSDRLWERAPDDAGLPAPAGRHGRAAVADDGQGGQRRRPRPAPRAGGRSPAASASSTTCRSPSTCSSIGGVGLAGPLHVDPRPRPLAGHAGGHDAQPDRPGRRRPRRRGRPRRLDVPQVAAPRPLARRLAAGLDVAPRARPRQRPAAGQRRGSAATGSTAARPCSS